MYIVILRCSLIYGACENTSLLFRSQTKKRCVFLRVYSFQNILLIGQFDTVIYSGISNWTWTKCKCQTAIVRWFTSFPAVYTTMSCWRSGYFQSPAINLLRL